MYVEHIKKDNQILNFRVNFRILGYHILTVSI
jgi:hypothetical protein